MSKRHFLEDSDSDSDDNGGGDTNFFTTEERIAINKCDIKVTKDGKYSKDLLQRAIEKIGVPPLQQKKGVALNIPLYEMYCIEKGQEKNYFDRPIYQVHDGGTGSGEPTEEDILLEINALRRSEKAAKNRMFKSKGGGVIFGPWWNYSLQRLLDLSAENKKERESLEDYTAILIMKSIFSFITEDLEIVKPGVKTLSRLKDSFGIDWEKGVETTQKVIDHLGDKISSSFGQELSKVAAHVESIKKTSKSAETINNEQQPPDNNTAAPPPQAPSAQDSAAKKKESDAAKERAKKIKELRAEKAKQLRKQNSRVSAAPTDPSPTDAGVGRESLVVQKIAPPPEHSQRKAPPENRKPPPKQPTRDNGHARTASTAAPPPQQQAATSSSVQPRAQPPQQEQSLYGSGPKLYKTTGESSRRGTLSSNIPIDDEPPRNQRPSSNSSNQFQPPPSRDGGGSQSRSREYESRDSSRGNQYNSSSTSSGRYDDRQSSRYDDRQSDRRQQDGRYSDSYSRSNSGGRDSRYDDAPSSSRGGYRDDYRSNERQPSRSSRDEGSRGGYSSSGDSGYASKRQNKDNDFERGEIRPQKRFRAPESATYSSSSSAPPAGRGRGRGADINKPAWMNSDGLASVPAKMPANSNPTPSYASTTNYTAPPTSAAPAGRGRGRGSDVNKPAWMTSGIATTSSVTPVVRTQQTQLVQNNIQQPQQQQYVPPASLHSAGRGRGRGRGTDINKPAWMTSGITTSSAPPTGQPKQVQNNIQQQQYAPPPAHSAGRGRGRGRGADINKPAWMTQGKGV